MHLNKNDLVVSVMLVIVLVICFGDGLAIRYSRHLEFKAEMSSEHGFHRSTSGFRFKNYIFREQEARSNTTDTPVTTYNTTTYKTTTYASSGKNFHYKTGLVRLIRYYLTFLQC